MRFLDLVDPTTRSRLLALGQAVEVQPGEALMRRGAMGGDIFLVESGQLEAVDPRAQPALVLAVLGTGEVVGELGFVDAAPRSVDVRARTAARCRVWRRSQLLRVLREDPALAASFWAAVSEVAVGRIRTLTDTVRASTLARPDQAATVDAGETAELSAELHASWAHAEHPVDGDSPAAEILGRCLARITTSLGRIGDPDRADGVGAALAATCGEVLGQATTSRLLVQRPPGTPPTAELVHHLRGPTPAGTSPAGTALDAALRALPSLRAQQLLPGIVAPLLDLAPGPRLVLSLAPRSLGDPATTLPSPSALDLATGAPLTLPEAPGTVVLDGVLEGLPDRVLVSLCTRLRTLLAPGGRIVVLAARPAPDEPLLDHLLRWPMLRRAPATLAELLMAAGLAPRRVEAPEPGLAWTVHLATPEPR